MTRLDFERTGGLMGRKISLSLDWEDLPDEEVQMLDGLLEEAGFFDLPADTRQEGLSDSFTYTISVTTSSREHTVQTGELSAPVALKPLIEALDLRSRRSP